MRFSVEIAFEVGSLGAVGKQWMIVACCKRRIDILSSIAVAEQLFFVRR